MHTERPPKPADILKRMSTDELIAEMYRQLDGARESERACSMWGTAVEWEDLHW